MSSRKLSPAQTDYLAAVANLQVLSEELDELCPDCADDASEAELAAWEAKLEACSEALGMEAARATLHAARKALILWAVESVAPLGTPEQAATIRALAGNYRAQDRLVALAMRYAA